MAMTKCKECGHSIATSATQCPQCGAKQPKTKWWLWIPVGLFTIFIGYGFSIPKYKAEASKKREICEALAGPFRKNECQRLYEADIAAGRETEIAPARGYEAPIDTKLVEAADKARDAQVAATLVECKKNLAAKMAVYRNLMNSHQYWDASIALRRCADLQNDPRLKSLVAEAEKRQYVKEIESTGSTRDSRNIAIEALLRDYPETGAKYSKLLRK